MRLKPFLADRLLHDEPDLLMTTATEFNITLKWKVSEALVRLRVSVLNRASDLSIYR